MCSAIWEKEIIQASTPTREAKRETRLPLETKHMVNGNDVIRPWIIFWGAKLVSEYQKVQKCRFRLHYERVLCWTQLEQWLKNWGLKLLIFQMLLHKAVL